MKVITQGTVRLGAFDEKAKKLLVAYLKPGSHDLDDRIAKELIELGVARRHGASDDKTGGDARASGKPPGGDGRA